MKKLFFVAAVLALVIFEAGAAFAGVDAKDAMISYVGTEAFTKLTPEERQACVEWLASDGSMKEDCRKAAMKLVAIAPDVVSLEQRQALISAAAGTKAPAPVSTAKSNTPVIKKKDDTAAAAVVGGIVGLVAGLVIANNHHRHRSSSPSLPQPPEIGRGRGREPVPPQQHVPPKPSQQKIGRVGGNAPKLPPYRPSMPQKPSKNVPNGPKPLSSKPPHK